MGDLLVPFPVCKPRFEEGLTSEAQSLRVRMRGVVGLFSRLS